MIELLTKCRDNMESLECCHEQPHICDCSVCCKQDFHERSDTYDCEKKSNYYVINYGPSYASEIYYYLENSQILENNFLGQKINILSLGCGFAPDYLALERYISNKNLNIEINYTGLDVNNSWESARYGTIDTVFYQCDLIKDNWDITDFDLVFIVKLFSTLYRNKQGDEFLLKLNTAIMKQLRNGKFVIFNDINSCHMGRDVFHNSISKNFNRIRQYYFDTPPYADPSWIRIPQTDICFSIPDDESSLEEVCKTIIFEYKK